jgi:glycosyltransferase involved in cell wall biosynthesis
LTDALVERGHSVTLFGAGLRSGTRATFVSTNPQLQHERLGQVMPDLLHAALRGQLLTAARCLIMPIRWNEPFGMVMVEAMASGTPVVALRRGSVPEIVRHGVTGWICDDPEELPEGLRRSGGLDSAACVAHVRKHFSAGAMAQAYENVYRKTIFRHRRGRDVGRRIMAHQPAN